MNFLIGINLLIVPAALVFTLFMWLSTKYRQFWLSIIGLYLAFNWIGFVAVHLNDWFPLS